jgi:WXXGXW repeat (2 copies)
MTEPCFRATKLVAISVLAALLGGCIVAAAPPQRYYVGTVVATAPPPPRVEVYGAAPAPGYVWLGGYWGWTGGRHEWVAGHWERPHPRERWVAHRWVHERDGWHLSEGHWERR